MELDPVPIKRQKETRTWHEIDAEVNNRSDTYANTYNKLSTKLSIAVFSSNNIKRIQNALRKYIFIKTKGIDIGLQPPASISKQLAGFYANLKYARLGNEINPDYINDLIRSINYDFLMEVLAPTVMNGLEAKELYSQWALKVPEPIGYGHNEKVVDKSIDMNQYHNDSLGGHYNNNWDWSKMAMYDEPESLYKRYPD